MISFDEAYHLVLNQATPLGLETVPLAQAVGRRLAKDVHTDRPAPPFDRSLRDGVAITAGAIKHGISRLRVVGTVAAGTHPPSLQDDHHCLEIMTGAVLPPGAAAVVRYEDVTVDNHEAVLRVTPSVGQHIERVGSHQPSGARVIAAGKLIDAIDMGVLATVGRANVSVYRLPRVAVLSTGNELVAVADTPLPHQIRQSNAHMLRATLQTVGIDATVDHLPDDPDTIRQKLDALLTAHDVLLLSGGVSRGKYDFIPEVLAQLGVQKLFHRVAQRPGKPFWFGHHPDRQATVFSFPGNPVSTWTCYTAYLGPWLRATQGRVEQPQTVTWQEDFHNDTDLTRLLPVRLNEVSGQHYAQPLPLGSSGDLFGLVGSDGLVIVTPGSQWQAGQTVVFHGNLRTAIGD